jgi:molybdopterin synthase catalytic subunit
MTHIPLKRDMPYQLQQPASIVRINVKFFAVLKDRAGVKSATIELPEKSNVSIAIESIANQFPSIRNELRRAAFAVNRNYTQSSAILSDGDELALIPPVSGG